VKDYTIQGWVMDEERLKNGGMVLTQEYFDQVFDITAHPPPRTQSHNTNYSLHHRNPSHGKNDLRQLPIGQ